MTESLLNGTTPIGNPDAHPNKHINDSITNALSAVSGDFATLLDVVPTADLRAEVGILSGGVNEMINIAGRARAAADDARTNLDLHPDGRAARARSALEEGEKALTETADKLRARAVILDAQLTTAALAEPASATDAQRVKADAQAVLQLAPDPKKAFEMLLEDDSEDMVAVMLGPWGTRISKLYGISGDFMSAYRIKALDHIASGYTPRARPAQAALQIRKTHAAIGSMHSLARQILR